MFQHLALAVHLSRAAYSDTEMEGAERFHSRILSATGYMIRGQLMDALVFRGTQEPQDWLIDATALPPVKYAGSWCHPGFAAAHKALWGKIEPRIDYDKPLLVTGHSLGAAMGDKSVDKLSRHQELHFVGFGKPNVHLKATAPRRTYLRTNLSVVSGSDIVARVPRFLYGPDPGQDMLYLSNQGMDIINPAYQFLLKDFVSGRPKDLIADHSMDTAYCPRVKAFLGPNPQQWSPPV